MTIRGRLRRLLAWCVARVPARVLTDRRNFALFERRGIHVTKVHFYSPIPDSRELGPELWARPSDLAGIDMNEAAQLEMLAAIEGGLSTAFERLAALQDPGAHGFDPLYSSFGGSDAVALYAILHRHRPRQVIEVGAGQSTLVSAKTLEQIATEDGRPRATLTTIDPCPWPELHTLPGLSRLLECPVQQVPLETFEALGADDILFIDSSHVVKTGSDVLFEILEVLPRLQPGVLVHFHDIFLPEEYPQEWLLERRSFWNEQYLLQAFLAFNDSFEVLWSGSWLDRLHRERFRTAFQAWDPDTRRPGSIWLRRRR